MSENLKRTNWINTDKRFVAFLDILGFKDMVMRSSHSEIYEKLNEISKAKQWLEEMPNSNNLKTKIGNGEIYTVSFSDSIVIFSKNDDIENFRFFIVSVMWFFRKAIENKTPMKGGIAHGEISLNKSKQIYFGQAIIDAYQMEEEVNYLGVTAHNSIDQYINNFKEQIEMEFLNSIVVEFETPLKCGNIIHKNLNWFDELKNVASIENESDKSEVIINFIKQFRLTSSGSPRRYVENTIKVYKSLKKVDE